VDSIYEDISIKHVVFVVNTEDTELVEAIDDYAHSRKLSYSLVVGMPGKGVGHAFFLGMQAAPPGPVVLTVGDSIPFNTSGLFDTNECMQIGVVRQSAGG
jgi:dTDP-glucose pyrophosphorylase